MSFSTEDRLQFVKWLADLGPDCDRSRIFSFVTTRKEEALSELIEQPGYEQVRAGLLRLLPELVPVQKDRQSLLAEIGPAITHPIGNGEGDRPVALSRHPAWIGLSVLEYCELIEREDGGLNWGRGAGWSGLFWPRAERMVLVVEKSYGRWRNRLKRWGG